MSSLFLHEMAYKTTDVAVPTIEMIYEGLLEFSDSFNNFNEAVLISDYKLMTENASLEEKSGFVSRVWEALKSLWEALKKRMSDIWSWMQSKIAMLKGSKQSFSGILAAKAKAFLELISKGAASLVAMGKDGVQTAIEKIKNISGTQAAVGGAVLAGLAVSVMAAMKKLEADGDNWVKTVAAGADAAVSTAIGGAKMAADAVSNKASEASASAIAKMKELMAIIRSFMSKVVGFFSFGDKAEDKAEESKPASNKVAVNKKAPTPSAA